MMVLSAASSVVLCMMRAGWSLTSSIKIRSSSTLTPLDASRWCMDHGESPVTTTNAVPTGTIGQLGLHESAQPLPLLFPEHFPHLTIAFAGAIKEGG
jgi:hypothetical protein